MPLSNLLRRIVLVGPFLAIIYFPAGGFLYNAAVKLPIDWNEGLVGLPARSSAWPPALKGTDWWTGRFQENYSKWFDDRCPGAAFVLRLFNQIDYSFFRSSSMLQRKLIVGVGGELDSLDHILDARHQNRSSSNLNIPQFITKLRALQDILNAHGKQLLVLTTPTKAATYPGTIPRRFFAYDSPAPRPYESFMEALPQSDLQVVDGAGIIHRLVGRTTFPLFVQGGVHWTPYAAAQVLPTVLQKVEELSRKSLPTFSLEEVKCVDAAQSDASSDRDFAILLNLMWPPLNYDCPKIHFTFKPKPSGEPARFVIAGGSFCTALIDLMKLAPPKDFPPPADGFYLQHFYLPDMNHPISRAEYEEKLMNSDLVLFEINEVMPMGVIDDLATVLNETFVDALSFAEGGNSELHVQSGFGQQEEMGRWTTDREASVVLFLSATKQDYRLSAEVEPYLSGSHNRQRVQILINGQQFGQDDLGGVGIHTISASFPASGLIRITFRLPDAISPAELGVSADQRKLALAFRSLKVVPDHAQSR